MSKAFIVLGMHRSATSLISGGLHNFGTCMGEHMLGADSANIEGYFEDTDFQRLNNRILSMAGGRWDSPPNEEDILKLRDDFEPEIKQLIRRKERKLWGWKDPRTTLTIRLFLPFLKNPHFIACFRKPHSVAQSLQKRDGFSIEKGLRIARIYNNRLTTFLKDYFS